MRHSFLLRFSLFASPFTHPVFSLSLAATSFCINHLFKTFCTVTVVTNRQINMSTANLFVTVTVRQECPVKMHPTVARFVFSLISSPVSCCPLSRLHTCIHANTTGTTDFTHRHNKQTNSLTQRLYNNCSGVLANSLCLLSLSLGYYNRIFPLRALLARMLISERLSFHTKEVLEINWRWSLQKLVAW